MLLDEIPENPILFGLLKKHFALNLLTITTVNFLILECVRNVLQVLPSLYLKLKIFPHLFFIIYPSYTGSSTETVTFQVYEILKIDLEFLQFF